MNILSYIRSLFSSEVSPLDVLRVYRGSDGTFDGEWYQIQKRTFWGKWKDAYLILTEGERNELCYAFKAGAEMYVRIHNESKKERRKKIRLEKMDPVEPENVVYMSVPEIIDKHGASLSEKDIEHLKELAGEQVNKNKSN